MQRAGNLGPGAQGPGGLGAELHRLVAAPCLKSPLVLFLAGDLWLPAGLRQAFRTAALMLLYTQAHSLCKSPCKLNPGVPQLWPNMSGDQSGCFTGQWAILALGYTESVLCLCCPWDPGLRVRFGFISTPQPGLCGGWHYIGTKWCLLH